MPVSETDHTKPVSDLIYDPTNQTIRSSIANIPEIINGQGGEEWSSRTESINMHHQLVTVYAETRNTQQMERTYKTNRGWWIVWMRVNNNTHQEALLIRRASDYYYPHRHDGNRFFRDLGGVVSSSSSSPVGTSSLLGGFGFLLGNKDLGPGRIVEGLGLDPRRYVEGLLGLNR